MYTQEEPKNTSCQTYSHVQEEHMITILTNSPCKACLFACLHDARMRDLLFKAHEKLLIIDVRFYGVQRLFTIVNVLFASYLNTQEEYKNNLL